MQPNCSVWWSSTKRKQYKSINEKHKPLYINAIDSGFVAFGKRGMFAAASLRYKCADRKARLQIEPSSLGVFWVAFWWKRGRRKWQILCERGWKVVENNKTFYPENWTKGQVIEEMAFALKNKGVGVLQPNGSYKYTSSSSTGFEIEIFIKNNKIETIYPK